MRRPPSASTKTRLVALVLCATTTTLGACATGGDQDRGTPYVGTLVTDPPLHPADVVLHDTDNGDYSLGQVGRDGVTALFFGFTHCEDVCPTTMADLAAARRSMPTSLANRVEVVFVTVDPARDTAEVLDRWLSRFDRSFIGLRGPLFLVHKAEDSLYSSQSTVERPTSGEDHHAGSSDSSSNHDGYEVTHSGLVYVFAPGGKSLLYTNPATATEYANDFTHLLGSP